MINGILNIHLNVTGVFINWIYKQVYKYIYILLNLDYEIYKIKFTLGK